MKSLAEYFTWPLFIFRLVIITVSLPILFIIGAFLTGMTYVEDKLDGEDDSFIESLIETFTNSTGKCVMYLVGGRNIFKD